MILDAHRCCRYNSYLSACMLGIHLQIPLHPCVHTVALITCNFCMFKTMGFSEPQNWFPILHRRFGVLGSHHLAPSNITLGYKLLWENHVSKLKTIHICHQINLESNIYWTQIAFLELGKMYSNLSIFKLDGSLVKVPCPSIARLPSTPKITPSKTRPLVVFELMARKARHEMPPMLPMFPGTYYVSSWFLFI